MLHMEIKRIKKKQTALLYFVVVFLSFFAPSFASHGDSSWPNKKLRLAVPQKSGRFSELVNITRDVRTNTTTISGFCIDVFKAAIEELDYQVDYELIPFVNATGQRNGTYTELIDQIFFQCFLMFHMEIKRIKKKQVALFYFVVVFLSFFAPSFASHGDSSWPNKKLRLAVPQKSGRFSELVSINRDLRTNTTTISGFCIDVFKAAIEELDYQVDYELIPFVNATGQRNGTYTQLIEQIFFQNYDGAVGDITITANRSLYVDFTLPYTDLGVGMIAPKGSNNMWIFLKPLTTDLWLSSAAFFVLTGFVIWLIERPINHEFQGSMSQQIGIIFWFSFSTLVFAHKEKLRSNLSRFVVIVWVFVVLILTSSYTATLTSMITVQHIQLNSKENYIGYRSDNSPITNTKGVISNLNFKNTNLKSFTSTDDYANALSRGIKNGGVSAIIDEIPYIKVFLSKYSADYSMVKTIPNTNGFAFVFRKGCPLVPDLSRAIAKLREDGKLNMMENEWFKSRQSTFTSSDSEDPSNNNYVNPLTLDSFRGLFLITGVSSTLALAILYSYWLYKNWHVMKNCNFRELIRTRSEFMKEYLSKKIYHGTGETNCNTSSRRTAII